MTKEQALIRVANGLGVSVDSLKVGRRGKDLARNRAIACWCLHSFAACNYQQIADLLGYRTRDSVMSAIMRVDTDAVLEGEARRAFWGERTIRTRSHLTVIEGERTIRTRSHLTVIEGGVS